MAGVLVGGGSKVLKAIQTDHSPPDVDRIWVIWKPYSIYLRGTINPKP